MKLTVSSPVIQLKKETPSNITVKDQEIYRWFGQRINEALLRAEWLSYDLEKIEEIRLRVNQPLMIRAGSKEFFVTSNGQKGSRQQALIVSKEDLIESLEKMTHSSIYAAEEELRQGFLTLPGGHRVGIAGETIVEHGKIRTLRNISALNLRLARQTQTEITNLLKLLLDKKKKLYHTLLISPPRAGKTTILRLLIRHLSEGIPAIGLEGQSIGVVDERSEIAGMWQGKPSFNLGCRTDVLDRCPKAQGIIMLIRSMAPDIVAVDELGSPEDIYAIGEALRCGVKVLATAHAGSMEELHKRTQFRELLSQNTFEKVVILSRSNGPGTIEGVFDL